MGGNAIANFISALDSWRITNLIHGHISDLEFDELVRFVAPWMNEALELVGEFGLGNLAEEGERLQTALNKTLDACECWCEIDGSRFGEMMGHFEGIEDVLVGLALVGSRANKPAWK